MRFHRWAVAVVLIGGLVACGSGGVEPEVWTRNVCESLIDRRLEIQGQTSTTTQRRPDTKSTGEYRALLVTMLSGQEKATEVARQHVIDAGIPDVEDGEQVAGQLVASLTTARDAYATARVDVERMQVERIGDFYTELDARMEKLRADVAGAEFDPAALKAKELRDGFTAVPACLPFWEHTK